MMVFMVELCESAPETTMKFNLDPMDHSAYGSILVRAAAVLGR